MIRRKIFFTTSSILSMILMAVAMVIGVSFKDKYCVRYHYYSTTYSYETFAENMTGLYVLLSSAVVVYITFGIIAIALYNKRIKAINIVNLILTTSVYVLSLIITVVAIGEKHDFFSFCLVILSNISFIMHMPVEILALTALKSKVDEAKVSSDACLVSNPPKIYGTNDAIDMLKQLKKLYDEGVLTEEEYRVKKKQYVDQL